MNSVLVLLVPMIAGPLVYYAFDLDHWPWFIYPLIWVVGLTWIWWPRKDTER